WETCLREFDIAAKRVVNARGASNLARRRTHVVDLTGKNQVLDLRFDLVVEFVAVVPKKFDAVVFVRVVRSGKNDPGIGAQRACNICHAGSWQRTNDEDINSERSDSGNQRVLEHVTRKPSVFAEDD